MSPLTNRTPLQRRTPLHSVGPQRGQVISFAAAQAEREAREARAGDRRAFHAELAQLSGLAPVYPPGGDPAVLDPDFGDLVRVQILHRFDEWPHRPARCDLALFTEVTCWGQIEAHHRQPKGSGGSSRGELGRASNGIACCTAHHAWIHHHPAWAAELGVLLSKFTPVPPAEIPVRLDGGSLRVLLTDAGGYEILPGDAA